MWGWEWFFITAGNAKDQQFISYVKEKNEGLYNRLFPCMVADKVVTDEHGGIIDLAHFAATLEAYLTSTIFPSHWASWGGDLATGMADTTEWIKVKPGMSMIPVQTVANAVIGGNTKCNYSDFCCDFDAYGIYQYIQNHESDNSKTILTDAFSWYYSSEYKNRFKLIFKELDCPMDLQVLKDTVYAWMNGPRENAGLLSTKAGNPSEEVNRACCHSFAQYIFKMI